jgi:quinolinate synthase
MGEPAIDTQLPAEYRDLDPDVCLERIAAAKKTLGSELVILGHHYQDDDVIRFADFEGDSFKLAREAAKLDARYIVFCGVHFMAESADILSKDHQQVILPDLEAGCSMADMATLEQVEECWELLAELSDDTIVPVTYMNSSAAIKAFCGRHGGVVCTSSNAHGVLEWAFERGQKVLFLPDEHLGRNTGADMGISLEAMPVYDPLQPPMMDDEFQRLAAARIVLWKGCCSVHQMFLPMHVDMRRREYPDVRIVVHPECRHDVVNQADVVDSTEGIIREVERAPAGATLAIGTEVHLVNRLAKRHSDKNVMSLSSHQCLCATMYRIDPPHLLWALENLVEGRAVNVIEVDEDTSKHALVALDRMLAI